MGKQAGAHAPDGKRWRPQFRLSTLLVLVFIAAIFLGANILPSTERSVGSVRAESKGSRMLIDLRSHDVYGWPFWVYENIKNREWITWKNPADFKEIETHFGIKRMVLDDPSVRLDVEGAYSWKAALCNIFFLLIILGSVCFVLERKRRKVKEL